MSNLDDESGLDYFDGQSWQRFTSNSTGNELLNNDMRILATDGVCAIFWFPLFKR
jgi:hypothetical protein